MGAKIFIAAILLLPFIGASQTKEPKAPEPLFVALYTIGAKWDTAKDFEEQPFAKEHSAYLAKLRKEKVISIGGRYSDTGMLIFKAQSEAKAKELITKDDAVKNSLFKVEIYPFDPFYSGCVK